MPDSRGAGPWQRWQEAFDAAPVRDADFE